MGYEATHNAIRNRFNANFVATTDTLGTDDVAWDNTTFETHDDGDTSAWVRFQVLDGESQIRNLGGTTARTLGLAVASVFVQAGQGDKLGLEITDEIVTAFKGVTHTYGGVTVNFRTPSVSTIGRDGSWWQINVTIPFYTDDA
tara:strand:+ start:11119 stop:11547 length:429 start_codon:yes stop_codon:yes gene_type:complete